MAEERRLVWVYIYILGFGYLVKVLRAYVLEETMKTLFRRGNQAVL